MANSDKNILVTPSVGLSTNPTIKFNGANNTPTTLRVLDDGTVSFEGTAGQLFSISDGLSGSIFSVNDISGIPSIEVLDTGLVKANQYGGSTVFGSSSAIQNSSLVNAKVSISTASATTPGLIIKAVSSQSANLQEWQNSAGTVLTKVDASGDITLPNGISTSGGVLTATGLYSAYAVGIGLARATGNANLAVTTGSTTNVGILVRGATSQTANLQEWQLSSATVGAYISNRGDFGTAFNLSVGGVIYAGGYLGSILSVSASSASTIAAIIKGAASQTADLQQWQNSAGTVLAKVDAVGKLIIGNPSSTPSGYYIDVRDTGAYPTISVGQTNQNRNIGMTWQVAEQSGAIQTNANAYPIFMGNNYLYVNGSGNSGTVGINNTGLSAQLGITNAVTTNAGLIVKGAASQTADLQQWQNSAGDIVAALAINTAGGSQNATLKLQGAYGGIISNGEWSISRNGGDLEMLAPTNYLVRTAYAGSFIIRGAASQTANIQEWQSSAGALLARVTSSGGTSWYGGYNQFTGDVRVGTTNYYDAELNVQTRSTGEKGIVVRALASQTANLQEWQNSAGDVLARFDPYGYFNAYGYTLPTSNGSFESAYGGAFMAMKKTTSAVANPASDVARIYLVAGTNAGTLKLVVKAGTAGAETTILDNIPQS